MACRRRRGPKKAAQTTLLGSAQSDDHYGEEMQRYHRQTAPEDLGGNSINSQNENQPSISHPLKS